MQTEQLGRSGMRRRVLLGWFTVTLAGTARPLAAQSGYPNRQINLLVGFPPGGSTDFVGRVMGQKLAEALGQPVVVENRPGANGLIATNATAAAPPDGYTICLTSMGLTTNPHLYTRSRRDPVKEFSAISLIATVPNVLVTNMSVPARNLGELIRHARSRSTPLTVANTGQAAPGHLTGELVQRAAKISFEFIAYKGSGPALTDIAAGHIDMSFPTVVAALPLLKAGKLRALAVTGSTRSALLPDVPTLGEAGLSEAGAGSGWYGLVGPAGMPRDVVDSLAGLAARIVRLPDVRERFISNGADPVGSSSAEMADFIARDYRHWGELIKAANIKSDGQ